MKYFFATCIMTLFFNSSVFSQEKTTTHKVEKGETISQIAQKYNVTPYDIFQLNPDAQSGLKPNSVLLIPKNKSQQKVVVQKKPVAKMITHNVAPKETLYGIEKKYDVSDEALKKANPFLEKEGLQIGQTLVIPTQIGLKTSNSVQNQVVFHDVLPKETKYSIAKKYDISIDELEKKNPEIVANLPVGFKLIIKGNPSTSLPKVEKSTVRDPAKEMVQVLTPEPSPKIKYIEYTVKPKETLFRLSKMAGLSQEEMIALNPDLAKGVEVGMVLRVPSSAAIPQEPETKKAYISLSKQNGLNDRKKLVLLLPFNLSKIEGDSINSTAMRLKKDKFLNMTLDFYAGALIAIDSAKQLGLAIDVSIFDSQETKNSSNVAALIKANNLENAAAIIGPFYQSNVEKTAELLNSYEVPVISPLSKDTGASFSNVLQTIPTTTVVKNAVFDFMRAKNGNIIAVVDKKKGSVIQFIQENHKDVKFSTLTANVGVSAENLKSLFVKDRINYVVMETENTGMIKATMSVLLNAMAAFKVQLVILEPNETLDTDEINFQSLAKLKLMYPSVTRENQSTEAMIFEKEFKRKNKIYPSTFATRGFDITFDTMMRLSQDKKYQETIESTATEQVDNKFEFYKKEDGGYINKGVYILYYDTDLTIKQAN
ncbi:amino acid ABC transporter substrate-binding protein [Flavobacterium sp. XS1P32]|uniref:amino acid ABC transporter substrate-binding protein n=1 Tax=Flavobacterium sp. XS1P32 TaxID=3401726 RepID=UPI003AAA42CA